MSSEIHPERIAMKIYKLEEGESPEMKYTTLIRIWLSAIALSMLFLLIALIIDYVAVDRSSPSAAEASVPAPRLD